MTENENKRLTYILYKQGIAAPIIAQMLQLTEEEVIACLQEIEQEGYNPNIRKPYERKLGRPTDERNKAICEAYTASKGNTVTLGKQYGISRERVAQILRKNNLIELRAERNKLAREMIAEDRAVEKAAVLANFRRAEALVSEGKSINEAAFEVGLVPTVFQHWLKLNTKTKSRHGRWQDWQPRIDRFLALRKAGHTIAKTIKIMNAEGEKIHVNWIYRHGLHHQLPEEYNQQKHPLRKSKKGKHK